MTMEEETRRAETLANQAAGSFESGKAEEASNAIREAISIAPDSAEVRRIFDKIQYNESTNLVLRCCRDLAHNQNEDAAVEAIRLLKQPSQRINQDAGEECTRLLVEEPSRSDQRDELLALLIQRSRGCQLYLIKQLQEATTNEVFECLWRFGERTTSALINLVSLEVAWEQQESRKAYEQEMFLLLLAKLMDIQEEHKAKVLKGLIRLLEADAPKLARLVDEDCFQTLLVMLDTRSPPEVRSFATLTIAKILETRQDEGQRWLTSFITSKVSAGSNEDLVLAFLTAAAVFPILPAIAASLFLTEGFVESLLPLLQKKSRSSRVLLAALEMLNAACIEGNCRAKVRKLCAEWLETVVKSGTEHNANIAAVILAKIRGTKVGGQDPKGEALPNQDIALDELVTKFKSMIGGDDDGIHASIEGLAYSSLQAPVKKQVASDEKLLQRLLQVIENDPEQSSDAFGALTIFANLTNYLPHLSEEQKRMSQLKAYANASKGAGGPHELDKDNAVKSRCQAVLKAGYVPVAVAKTRKVSPSALSLILTTLMSLAKDPQNRGTLAQEGAVKLLISSCSAISDTEKGDKRSARIAAHALSRVMISINPSLAFNVSSLPAISSIRPLLLLFQDDPTAEQKDLLPQFESLLALTNIASADDAARRAIIDLAWSQVEDLLLSNHTMIRRATVELVCNLMASPEGVAKFADGSTQASNRMHIILALADVDDLKTRSAAGGALAMLTEWEPAVDAVISRDRGIKILLGLCQDQDPGLVHRGCVCVCNILSAPGEIGVRAVKKVKLHNGEETLSAVLRLTRSPDVLSIGAEALKLLKAG